jgi:hypothetical protein
VCKLQKALYGLKQAHRAWYSWLSTKLLEMGFVGSKSDQSLFLFNIDSLVMFVLVYVDDIVITSSVPSIIDKLIQELQSEFAIKD